jgi:hypothetical protein
MSNLKHELERLLDEHQRESGLHMIGGREKLVQRLLSLFDATLSAGRDARSEAQRAS